MGTDLTTSNTPWVASEERPWTLTLRAPSDDLSWLVERYWITRWDLRDRAPYWHDALPHPCVHLVLMPGVTGVFGVMRDKLTIALDGAGVMLGVRLRPGAMLPLLGTSVSEMTDRLASFQELFGVDDRALRIQVLGGEDDDVRVAHIEQFLRARSPVFDERVSIVSSLVSAIAQDPQVLRVEDLSERSGLSTRVLRRLFLLYVGVGPQWVIRRSRLRETARQLSNGLPFDALPALSQRLGYLDPSQLDRDFKAMLGKEPAHYAAQAQRLLA